MIYKTGLLYSCHCCPIRTAPLTFSKRIIKARVEQVTIFLFQVAAPLTIQDIAIKDLTLKQVKLESSLSVNSKILFVSASIFAALLISHKGMYNSLDSCCIFDIHRQLNRQHTQWIVYLAVCKPFNTSTST
jgi:hypothetical protein